MAQRRMLSSQIVNSDAFLDMPTSSQLLYFHLVMQADDDGFVGNPKRVMRMIGTNEDDFKILIGKRFLLTFESGVVVIKHWLIHNTIRLDRYHSTQYKEEKRLLFLKENKSYSDVRQPVGNQLETEVNLIEVKLSKDNIKDKHPLPDWIDQSSWLAWEVHRKEKRQKLTQSSIRSQIKFLEEHKEDHVKIIEQSIRNGWTGLFPLKNNTKKKMYVA